MDTSQYHLNTVYLKPSQQLTPGPYQSLRSQLSRQNYFNPRYIEKSTQNNMQQAMNELKKIMAGTDSIDHNKLAHIHSIKLNPIINQNFISSFDQSQYKLQPQDKVKIVKEKVFRVQNYYNYLYELKCKQEHTKMQKNLQELLLQAKQNTEKHSPNKKIPDSKVYQKPIDSIKDSRIEQKSLYLAPEYSKYEPRQSDNQRYFLKQKERKKVQQSLYKRY